jgi:hypothetical protein
MRQKLDREIRECYEHAQSAAARLGRVGSFAHEADFFDMEKRRRCSVRGCGRRAVSERELIDLRSA